MTSDGSSRAAGLRLYVNGQPVPCDTIRDALTRDITGGGGDNISLGERFRDRGFKGGAIDEFRVFGRELGALEVATCDEAAAKCRARAATPPSQKVSAAPSPRPATGGEALDIRRRGVRTTSWRDATGCRLRRSSSPR